MREKYASRRYQWVPKNDLSLVSKREMQTPFHASYDGICRHLLK